MKCPKCGRELKDIKCCCGLDLLNSQIILIGSDLKQQEQSILSSINSVRKETYNNQKRIEELRKITEDNKRKLDEAKRKYYFDIDDIEELALLIEKMEDDDLLKAIKEI